MPLIGLLNFIVVVRTWTQSTGLLSYTFLQKTFSDDIRVPIVGGMQKFVLFRGYILNYFGVLFVTVFIF